MSRNGINLADWRFNVQVQLNIETRTSTARRVGHWEPFPARKGSATRPGPQGAGVPGKEGESGPTGRAHPPRKSSPPSLCVDGAWVYPWSILPGRGAWSHAVCRDMGC